MKNRMDSMSSPNSENSTVTQAMIKQPFSLTRFARENGTQLGILAVFFTLWIVFIFTAPGTFLQPRIYLAFMSTVPFYAMMAIPLTLLIIAKEMDLSFPSIMAMGMVTFLLMFDATKGIGSVPTRVLISFVLGTLTGGLIGWINGVIVVKFGIPSLVATIGTQFFWRGAVLVLSQGSSGTLSYVKESFLYPLFVGKIGGVFPIQMIWLIVITVLGWLFLNHHRFGAHVYLIGDNIESAKLMGINTGRVRIQTFMLVGLVSAFAGIVASFYVVYFWPSLGDGYLLRTLASVFLGGTSVFGGVGTVLGTFIGAFIIGSIEAATVAVGLTGFWTQLIYGLIIVLSVIMHTFLRKRTE